MKTTSSNHLAAALLGCAAILVVTPPLPAALVARLTFDDPAHLNADSSGNGNDATTGGSPSATPGIAGGAASFNGSSYFKWEGSGSPVVQALNASFTVCVWVRSTQTFATDASYPWEGAGLVWADYPGTPPVGDTIPLALTGSKVAGFANSPTVHSTNSINSGQWTHLAFVRYANAATGYVRLFVNGRLEATDISNGQPASDAQVVSVAANLLDGRYYVGAMDDLRLYNTALSDSEIAFLFVESPAPPEIYFAEDVSPYAVGGPNQVPRPLYPQSQTAAAQFLARLHGATTESFEGLATGSLPAMLAFGTNTATLSVSSSNVCAVQTVVDPATTDGGWFPTTGTNFLGLDIGRTNQTDKYFRIEFSSPQAAFGFYGTDVELNQFRLRFVRADGATNDVLVPITVPQGSGGVFYFGIIDRDRPFISVLFENLGQQPDGMGFDDLTMATRQQVTTIRDLLVASTVSPGGINQPERTNNGVLLYRYDGTPSNALQLVTTILPTVGNGLYDPVSVAFSPWGELFVGNRHGNQQSAPGSGSISRFLIDASGQVTPNGVIAGNGLWAVHDLAFSRAGELFAANLFADTISRFVFDAARNAVPHGTIVAPAGTSLEGLAFAPDGELFASTYDAISRYRFDAQGNAVANGVIPKPGSGRLHFIRFNAVGELFAPDIDGSRIYRFVFDGAGNAVAHGDFGAAAPTGQAFSPGGELFVTTHTGPPLYNVGSLTRFIFDGDGNVATNVVVPSNPANDPLGGIAMRLLDFPPLLAIARAATNTLVVSWPLPATGWLLHASTNLVPGGSGWTEIPPPYQTNGADLQFTEPSPAGNQFFRLHKP